MRKARRVTWPEAAVGPAGPKPGVIAIGPDGRGRLPDAGTTGGRRAADVAEYQPAVVDTAAEVVAVLGMGDLPATPDQAMAELQRAGATLAAMAIRDCWPADYRSTMPDIVRQVSEMDWADDRRVAIRPAVPSAADIERMDRAMAWLPLIGDTRRRVAVSLAMVVNPITLARKLSDRQIGKALGCSNHTVRRARQAGLGEIVVALGQKK